jgi:protein-serine/threonine kinase
MGQPSIEQPVQRIPVNQPTEQQSVNPKGHRRSYTVSETLGRVTSMFSGRQAQEPNQNQSSNKPQKSYPPTSMAAPIANNEGPRKSIDSSRRTSFGFSRKNSDNAAGGKSTRRFSLLPSSLSKTFSGHRESVPASSSNSTIDRRGSAAPSRNRATSRPAMAFGRGESRSPSRSTTGSNVPDVYDGQHDGRVRNRVGGPSSAPAQQTQFDYAPPIGDDKIPGPTQPHPATNPRDRPYQHPNDSEGSESAGPAGSAAQQYPAGFNSNDSAATQRDRPGVLQKNRKFVDAYDDPKHGHHSGSSGSAKRVMDLFRRIGRQREKDR